MRSSGGPLTIIVSLLSALGVFLLIASGQLILGLSAAVVAMLFVGARKER